MFFKNILKSYFEEQYKGFCLICGKSSKNIFCLKCNNCISNIKINNDNISFFKDSKYWIIGNNNHEEIKSYGLYLLQRLIPISTIDIINYIKEIKLINQEKNFFYINVFFKSGSIIKLEIPKVKSKLNHFISYKNLFLYPELEKNKSLLISNK